MVGVQQAARHDWNAMNLDAADIAEQSRRILLSCLDCSQERLQSGSTGPKHQAAGRLQLLSRVCRQLRSVVTYQNQAIQHVAASIDLPLQTSCPTAGLRQHRHGCCRQLGQAVRRGSHRPAAIWREARQSVRSSSIKQHQAAASLHNGIAKQQLRPHLSSVCQTSESSAWLVD